jgi:hypothetical protein
MCGDHVEGVLSGAGTRLAAAATDPAATPRLQFQPEADSELATLR